MEVKLQAQSRSDSGKGFARKLRASGRVPAVLYGHGGDPQHLSLDARELNHALHTDAGANVLVDLQLDGEEFLSMPREVQRDPLRGSLIHVDFLRISRDERITVDIPVTLVGDAPGVREGGIVDHQLWTLKVECLPGNVPEQIEADVSGLAIGDVFYVRELQLPEDVVSQEDPDAIVVQVAAPQVEVVEEPAEAVEGEVPAEGEAEGESPEQPGGEG